MSRARSPIFTADIESTAYSNSQKRRSLILPASIRHFPSEIRAEQRQRDRGVSLGEKGGHGGDERDEEEREREWEREYGELL